MSRVVNRVLPLSQHVVNILSVYSLSDNLDKSAGMSAYLNYNYTMQGLADKYNTDIQSVAGAFAALSPNATYASNLSSTESLLSAWKNDRPMESVKVSTYLKNRKKAWDILRFDSSYVNSGAWTTGKKTFAFYCNIVEPDDTHAPVVVDGHIYSIWMLKVFKMSKAKVGNGGRYENIANDIRYAAKIAGITASQMQAVCWFTWKRVNRISFDTKELQRKLGF